MVITRYRILGAVLALTVVAAGLALVGPPRSAVANPVTLYLDLAPSPEKVTSAEIPGTCAAWHELFPSYCIDHHQTDYNDGDGDSLISACDNIQLDGIWYHITWVGPTIFLSCDTDQSSWEPTEPQTGDDPTCETWTEVHPDFGNLAHVDGWSDNGDGVLSECDFVLIAGQSCHVDRIGLNIIVEPGSPTSIEESTWGRIKGLFRKLR